MPGQTSQIEIPDDVKQFLRSILISLKGVKQSKIEHDYHELVGETLPWRKLGFKNLFEFLVAVPDVAKMEFREKDEENRVFAVLDTKSFSSLHAKRMSVKGFGQGTKPLSPAEIIEWKARKIGTFEPPGIPHSGNVPNSSSAHGKKKSTRNKLRENVVSASRNNKFSTPAVVKSIGPRIEPTLVVPASLSSNKTITKNQQGLINITFANNGLMPGNDVDFMAKYESTLFPNDLGLFSICIRWDACQLPEKEVKEIIRCHFTLPGCDVHEIHMAQKGSIAFVRFKSKFEAAYTIEKTNNTTFKGLKFRVSPATEKKVKGSNGKPSSAQNTALLLNPGLLSEPYPVNTIIPNNSSAVSSGLTLQAGRRDSHNSIPQLPSPRTINGTNTTNVNQNRPNVTSCDKTSAIMQERSNTKWPQFESPDEKPLEIVTQMKNHIQDRAYSATEVCQKKKPIDNWLDYPTMEKMFQMSCRKKPKFSDNFPKKITFIVTFVLDACRFWIQRLDFEESCRKLNERLCLELEKGDTLRRVFPNKNHFGAAKFKEDGMWYRCWVLDSDKANNKITVYFCDFGNMEVISQKEFTHINPNYWVLPPQGIPTMLHGMKRVKGDNARQLREEVDLLNMMCSGKLIESEVVMEESELRTSQPHVLQLKNILVSGIDSEYLEDRLLEEGIVMRNNEKDPILARAEGDPIKRILQPNASDNTVSPSPISCSSLYEYNRENLTKMKILEVESPHLFHIKTKDSDELLEEINHRLALFSPEEKAEAIAGSIACLMEESGNKRVKIMDLACNFLYSKRVAVVDIDSGQKILANSENLYVLSKELRQLKEAATVVGLAGIKPKDRVTNITTMLRERIGKVSYMNIVGESESGKVLIELFKGDLSSSFNMEVVQHGLAKVIHSGPCAVPRENNSPKGMFNDRVSGSSQSPGPVSPSASKPRGEFAALQQPANEISPESLNKPSTRPRGVAGSRPSSGQKSPTISKASGGFASLPASYSPSSIPSDGVISDASDATRKVRPYMLNGGEGMPESMKNGNYGELGYESSSSCSISDYELSVPGYSGVNAQTIARNDDKPDPAHFEPRFRPHTPPLPPLIDMEDGDEFALIRDEEVTSFEEEVSEAEEVTSFEEEEDTSEAEEMMTFEEIVPFFAEAVQESGLNDFIRLTPDGRVDKEAIKKEIRRWNNCKESLERYMGTLKDALNLTEERTSALLAKNKRQPLKLHVKINESQKQLLQLQTEQEELKKQILKYS